VPSTPAWIEEARELLEARLHKMKTAEELVLEQLQMEKFNEKMGAGGEAVAGLTTKRAIKHHETKAKTKSKKKADAKAPLLAKESVSQVRTKITNPMAGGDDEDSNDS
jgi:hypothetical protein